MVECCDVIGCDTPEYADGVCREHHWMLSQDGYTYFLECGEFIKIGFSRNLKGRLDMLSCGNPYPIKLLATIRGWKHIETDLHERFASARHRGEWFRKTPELLDFVERRRGAA